MSGCSITTQRFSLPDEESHQRISAGVPGSDPEVFLRLARCLEEPLLLLHILHTTRGEAEPARFQSPELSFQEIEAFISAFRPFLANDSRFDLWVHSPSQQATLAWDRHDMLYAYGPLDDYEGRSGSLVSVRVSHRSPCLTRTTTTLSSMLCPVR